MLGLVEVLAVELLLAATFEVDAALVPWHCEGCIQSHEFTPHTQVAPHCVLQLHLRPLQFEQAEQSSCDVACKSAVPFSSSIIVVPETLGMVARGGDVLKRGEVGSMLLPPDAPVPPLPLLRQEAQHFVCIHPLSDSQNPLAT
jgi:hypothetical protein